MDRRFSIPVVLGILLFWQPLCSQARVFHDALGRKVTLASVPTRIVSLAPSITEMVYFLGLEGKLVGVTRFSSFPKEAQKKPKVGIYTGINIEKVVSLDPELVIATVDGNRREDVEMLEEIGIPVYVINPRTVSQILETLKRLGEVCGVSEKSERLASSLNERVSRVERLVRNKRKPLVLLAVNMRPLMSVNSKTIHHNLIQLAGGRNMTGDQAITYPKLNIEEVIKRQPDVIIISSMEKGGRYETARKEWYRYPTVPAVREGRVHLIDSDLIDRPAPRIVRGLEEMARLIHPEVEWNER
jgi:iron complex transport system substrate-binding protein